MLNLHWSNWIVGILAVVAFFALGSQEAIDILKGLGLPVTVVPTIIAWAKFIILIAGILGYSPLKKNPVDLLRKKD